MIFRNRSDAGRRLAAQLAEYAGRSDLVVLALPRGGVPVAYEIALALGAPLDVFLVRKLGVPGHPELAMGAIAAGGIEVLSHEIIQDLRIPMAVVRQVAALEQLELDRRGQAYRGDNSPPVLRGKTVLLVDDGLATGSTMEAAIMSLKHSFPSTIVVAVPVGSRDAVDRIAAIADRMVCPEIPADFSAVGQWYADFSQTTDDEVRQLLADRAAAGHPDR